MNIGNAITFDQRLRACRAIILYEDRTTALATVHDIDVCGEDQPPMLLAGKLLTQEMLHEMLKKVSGSPQKRALLPENVLCYDSGMLLWWKPQTRLPIFFKTAKKEWDADMNGQQVLHPPLVFCAQAGRLSVWSLQENVRPMPATKLCKAPYYNIYDGGAMCAGNTRLPEVVLPSDLPIWETAFFQTNFTHSNQGAKLVAHPRGHDGFWQDMRPQGAFLRPAWLIPTDRTLEKVISQ